MAAKKKTTRRTAATTNPSPPSNARPVKTSAGIAKVAKKKNIEAFGEMSDPSLGPFPVVGIGASAGGLEALSEFFRTLKTPFGMAIVVVTHLDPDHKSAMTEILSHTTSMPVTEVSDATKLQVDHVYVIPPNSNMELDDDLLRLVPRENVRGPHMPIDVFLRSLAIARRSRAVGVILSGTASDGTLGLKAIKGEGGITIAQDNTAKHDGMPRSAINAGCVDFVLPPARIAEELSRLGAHPYLNGGLLPGPPAATVEKQDDFDTVVRLLSAAVGVDFTHYKPPTLRRRIERRMLLCKQPSLKEYAQLLKEEPAELQALYQEVLIQVTGFFRDPEMFVALRETVFPKLVENRPVGAPLRIWVPGCSTGEEVYSLAISLLEFLEEQGLQTPIKVFATDIANRAIEVARAGVYLDSIAADVSPERLRRFFVKTDGRYQIQKPVRDLCVFARQDVTKDPPFSQIDLVSCRNVLIYLGPVLQYRVLPIFHYALRPNGVLILGESESIGGFTNYFDAVDKAHRFYLRKEAPRRLTFEFAPGRTSGTGLATLELADDSGRRLTEVQREADRVVLAKYAPAGVVIDDELRIIQFRGYTGAYLEPAPGTPNLDLLQMAREGLIVDLRNAIEHVKHDGVAQRRENVLVRSNGGSHEITLEVLPILLPASSKRFYVVLFAKNASEAIHENRHRPDEHRELARASRPGERERSTSTKQTELAARDREIERLKQELDSTKSYLQSVIEAQEAVNEELKAANEEIVSSNEELQSTNEELETAKEELQATNEELTTVNDELQSRIRIAAQFSDDLTNLIDSVNIPTVVLGYDLHIRRFSPSAQRVLNLIPTDIGRHIGDFKLKINVPDLEPMIQQVLDTLEVRQREVVDNEERWHKLVVRPYKTLDNKIDGAVITLSDIDALKRRERGLQESRDYAVSIVESVQQPLLILDADLRVRMANRSFYELFQVTQIETERQLFYMLGNAQWNIPGLRQLLENVLPNNSPIDGFEVNHLFPMIGQRSMLLNARRVGLDGTQPPHILLSIEDDTDHKNAAEAMRVIREINERKNIEMEVLENVAEEQRRIGQDLHDSTGQELTGLSLLAHELMDSLTAQKQSFQQISDSSLIDPSSLAHSLDNLAIATSTIVEGLDRALKQVRVVSKGLIPVDISADGLMVALSDLADNVSSQTKVKCHFSGPVQIHDTETATHLYRIAQEAITNSLKHSNANHISVSLIDKNDRVTLSIRDDGMGLSAQSIVTSGLGMRIMRYRASLIGATFNVETVKEGGTLVTCSFGMEPAS